MEIQFTDGGPTTEHEFAEALASVVMAAHRNDVTVLGGWECRSDDTDTDFEAVIVELEARSQPD